MNASAAKVLLPRKMSFVQLCVEYVPGAGFETGPRMKNGRTVLKEYDG